MSCAIVAAALGRAPRKSQTAAATVTPPGTFDGLGRPKRGRLGQRGVLSYFRGVGFRSRLESLVYERLWQLEEARPDGGGILRNPHYDLWGSWRLGMGKPLIFTPDFQVTRSVLSAGGLLVTAIEVHEAKGPRALESRDYVARLAAFRAAFPWLPFTVWRRDKAAGRDGLVREDLAALGADSTRG